MKKIYIDGRLCVGPTFSKAEFALIKRNLPEQKGLKTLADSLGVAGDQDHRECDGQDQPVERSGQHQNTNRLAEGDEDRGREHDKANDDPTVMCLDTVAEGTYERD